jgi:hypothetical protein
VYLRELFIKNSGPIRELHLELAFTSEGLPIPHLIVGRNGSGKTNVLSLIADALMEGAATVYNDILTREGIGRNWFRIVGGKTTSYNQAGTFSIFRFEHEDQQYFYNEHAGQITTEQVREMVPPSLQAGVSWNDGDADSKAFPMPEDVVRSIYTGGAQIFFPSSRSEAPFWLNQKSIFEDSFNTTENYTQSLNKPIYVEHGIDQFAQWLMGVLTEAKVGVEQVPNPDNPSQMVLKAVESDIPLWSSTKNTLTSANQILQAIVADSQAMFYWAGRRQARKVGVSSGGQVLAAGLDNLSGGQSSLLAIFGTILRYGDAAGVGPGDVQGVVVIDELDAHMHIDLQTTAVPKLVAMFPRVQFIISSHSPFFGLGMEKQFPDNVRIIDVPTGLTMSAESYSEFDSAMVTLMKTQAFEKEVGEALAASEQPVVWVAGETDVTYFRKASELLGYTQLVDLFEWIGIPGNSGGGEYTGDPNLKAALKFLKANAGFTSRTVIAIFDCDANQADSQFDNVYVIALEKIENAAVEDGVENLLPSALFTPEVFEDVQKPSGIAGKPKILPELRKTYMAEKVCSATADVANFQSFEPYLNRINEIVSAATEDQADEPTADPAVEGQPEPPPESSA